MSETIHDRILRDPRYHAMVAHRRRVAVTLSAVVLVVYFGFILLIAFAPQFLAIPLWTGAVTTIGIPIGLGVILMAFIVTGIYVHIANSQFDEENAAILKGVGL